MKKKYSRKIQRTYVVRTNWNNFTSNRAKYFLFPKTTNTYAHGSTWTRFPIASRRQRLVNRTETSVFFTKLRRDARPYTYITTHIYIYIYVRFFSRGNPPPRRILATSKPETRFVAMTTVAVAATAEHSNFKRETSLSRVVRKSTV